MKNKKSLKASIQNALNELACRNDINLKEMIEIIQEEHEAFLKMKDLSEAVPISFEKIRSIEFILCEVLGEKAAQENQESLDQGVPDMFIDFATSGIFLTIFGLDFVLRHSFSR
jgi:hypothetical protein